MIVRGGREGIAVSEERRDALEDAEQRASGQFQKIYNVKSWALRNLIGMRDDSHCCNMVVLQMQELSCPIKPFQMYVAQANGYMNM